MTQQWHTSPNSTSLFNSSVKRQRQSTLFRHQWNSPTCLASTAAVYSRLKLSSVIATSSRMRLKSLALSVSSLLMSRDTWNTHTATRVEPSTGCSHFLSTPKAKHNCSSQRWERHSPTPAPNHGHQHHLWVTYPQPQKAFSKLYYSSFIVTTKLFYGSNTVKVKNLESIFCFHILLHPVP